MSTPCCNPVLSTLLRKDWPFSPCAEGVKAHNRACWKLLTNKEHIQPGALVLPTALQSLYVNSAPSAFGGWQIRVRGAELWNVSWNFSGKISKVRVNWNMLGWALALLLAVQHKSVLLWFPQKVTLYSPPNGWHKVWHHPLLDLIWTRNVDFFKNKVFLKIHVAKYKLVVLVWTVKCRSFKCSRGKTKCSDSPFGH